MKKNKVILTSYVFILFFLVIPSNLGAINNKQITVVFRFDDYAATSSSSLELKILDSFKKHRYKFSLAVIPFFKNRTKGYMFSDEENNITTDKIEILNNYIKDNTIEVELHGYLHEALKKDANGIFTEFSEINYYDQQNKISKGKIFLENVIGRKIGIFVPPWNTFDLTTILVLQELGFDCISAGSRGVYLPLLSTKIKYLPATTNIMTLKHLITIARNINEPNPIIVVLFHLYDFPNHEFNSEFNFKNKDLKYITELLDWIYLQKDIQVKSIEEVIKDSEEFNALRYMNYMQFIRINSLLYPSFRFTEGIYYSVETLKRLKIELTLYVLGFYIASTTLFYIIYVILYRKINYFKNVKSSFFIYILIFITNVIIMYCIFNYNTITWRHIIILSLFLGSTIGSIRLYKVKHYVSGYNGK